MAPAGSEGLKALFQPIKMGEFTLKNRIAMSPMTRARSDSTKLANNSMKEGGVLPVAASAVPISNSSAHTHNGKVPYETPRALEESEMAGIVQQHVDAAQLCKDAGFDGVEIHSANGYLLNGFLETRTNKRTDGYGGTKEKRWRLVDEVLTAVCKVYPPSQVGIKMSPNGVYNDMGSPEYREDYLYYISQLEGRGLAYLNIMNGLGFGFHELGEPFTLDDVRSVFSGIIMANCGYDGPTAEADVAAGKADMVAFGRPFIANPDLPRRLQEGLPLAEMKEGAKFLYVPGDEGYIDYPTHDEQMAKAGAV